MDNRRFNTIFYSIVDELTKRGHPAALTQAKREMNAIAVEKKWQRFRRKTKRRNPERTNTNENLETKTAPQDADQDAVQTGPGDKPF